jgi:hypothetical protein
MVNVRFPSGRRAIRRECQPARRPSAQSGDCRGLVSLPLDCRRIAASREGEEAAGHVTANGLID